MKTSLLVPLCVVLAASAAFALPRRSSPPTRATSVGQDAFCWGCQRVPSYPDPVTTSLGTISMVVSMTDGTCKNHPDSNYLCRYSPCHSTFTVTYELFSGVSVQGEWSGSGFPTPQMTGSLSGTGSVLPVGRYTWCGQTDEVTFSLGGGSVTGTAYCTPCTR